MRWPEFNLAPIKYAKVHKDYGGPIERISFREITLFGKPAFEAFAYLEESVAGKNENNSVLYGKADGSGTAHSQAGAVYAAISEALERWAWRATLLSQQYSQLRYDLDSSTNGFAAFPGLFKIGVRRRAFFEAVERWSVAAWWEGKLGHAAIALPNFPSAVTGIQLRQIAPSACTVILKAPLGDFATYSFATAENAANAVNKALIELDRNQRTVPIYQNAKNEIKIESLIEKRLVFFASQKGQKLFERRLAEKHTNDNLSPRLIVDCEVVGPWSKYTHVWRCLFDNADIHETQNEDYFLF